MNRTLVRNGAMWSGFALLATAEIAVAALVLIPHVTPAYRAYYIDKSSDCWPHATAGRYRLGTTLSFVSGKGTDFAANKICGWFYPDADGTWSYGDFSLLRFVFSPVPGPLRLTFSAGALVDPDARVQRVLISANGLPIATFDLSSLAATEKSFIIPASVAASGRLELRFDYPDAQPGDELGPNEDAHPRAIRMEWLTLSAASELAGKRLKARG